MIDQATIITILITTISVGLITYEITKRSIWKKVSLELERDFAIKRNELLDTLKANIKIDEGYIATLNNEYLRGKIDGAQEELSKFNVKFQPYVIKTEELGGLRKKAEVGYEMQIFYGLFAIGDATKVVTHMDVKYDQAIIDKLINEVMKPIQEFSSILVSKGMQTKTLAPKKQ